jgi:DnaK suppressor protein
MTDIAIRDANVRHMLSARRLELQDEVQSRTRDTRIDQRKEVRNDSERSDADVEGDIPFALRIRVEALTRIDEALLRLDAGKYGSCLECGSEISERRLRALPFAVRCQVCEKSATRSNVMEFGDRVPSFLVQPQCGPRECGPRAPTSSR